MTSSILVGDCRQHMRVMASDSVDLIATDPPWGIGHEYDGFDDDTDAVKFSRFTADWLAGAMRILKPGGSLFVAMGDEMAGVLKCRLDETELDFRNWIVWHYTFGAYATHKFGRCHAHVLYYVKPGAAFTFNADAVRVPSARQEKYGDKRANPLGKIPGDVWAYSRVCGTFGEHQEGSANQLPEALVERIVKVASDPGDLVYDPFAGSGTVPAVARRLGRRWLASELTPTYAAVATKRLSCD